tara:strand:- start:978 stop:1322 length:345 start_codon:yes stop_codon:yes gene_type:complete
VAGSIILCLAAFRLVSSISTPTVMREKPLLLCAFVLASIGCTLAAPVIHASVFPGTSFLPFFLLPFVLAPALIVAQTWMALAMTRRIVLILALGPGPANVYALQKGDRPRQDAP